LGIKQKSVLRTFIAILIAVGILSLIYVQPASPCFGPCITADIDRTHVNFNETVTVTGQVCPPEENKTVRVAFTRPDYTYIDRIVGTDPKTGNFSVTQQLDMVGYWNIFPINGHIADRLYSVVTDPANPNAPTPTPSIPSTYRPVYNVVYVSVAFLILGGVAVYFGKRNSTRKISSVRLFVQIALVFLIFFGTFIDHWGYLAPGAELAPHEIDVATNVFGVGMPDGLPAPVFGCYYPCGRTVTCALWQIQTYIYPFFNSGGGWGVHYDSTGLARLAVVFGIIILGALILGRFFCGWICPFGLYVDLMTRLRKALKIKHRNLSDRFNERFHQLSYVILALIIILSIVFASQALSSTPLIQGTQKGGAVYNYYSAPFCQLCPMKPLCLLSEVSVGLMKPEWVTQTTTGQFWQLGQFLTSTNLLILGIVTVAAFFFRRSWCRICPLGGLIALFNRFPPFKWVSGVRLNKNEEKCTKCGICKRVCPTQVKEVYEGKGGDRATSQCIYCLRCVEMCPNDGCLEFKFAGKTVCKSRNWLIKSDSINGE
jgi:ferredoxin-type protein NapH